MKEFEEWWIKQEESRYNPGEWFILEKSWRAALEWVKDNCDLYDCDGGWGGYIIEDELGEEDE